MTSERWRAPWRALGVEPPDSLGAALLAAYREPQRRYHTMEHLDECLALFDAARVSAARPDEMELALWFHDAVYEPLRNDNESRSADWGVAAILDAGLPARCATHVESLILATRHDAIPDEDDARLLVDIDLAILGADDARFDEYEGQVRAEFSSVPEFIFRRGRRGILAGFLARPRIYSTTSFHDRFEARARANLARSIERLGG